MDELTTPRILIVEDDLALANLMAAILADAGFYADVASSVAHVDTARAPYDLIVSDYLAPSYRPDAPWPHLDHLRRLAPGGPIVGCTGHADVMAGSLGALGVDALLAKPFDLDELVGKIHTLLAAAEAGARN